MKLCFKSYIYIVSKNIKHVRNRNVKSKMIHYYYFNIIKSIYSVEKISGSIIGLINTND